MAQSHDTPDANPAAFLLGICGIIFLATCGAIGLLVANSPTVPPVDATSFMTKVHIDQDRLKAERQKRYGKVDLSGSTENVDGLLKTVRDFNVTQFDAADQESQRQASVATVFAANEVLADAKMEGFMVAGQAIFDGCRSGFAALQKAVSTGKVTPDVARKDPGPEFEEYRQNCGPGWGTLVDLGVIEPKGAWVDPEIGPELFEIMNRYRWASVLDLRVPPHMQLTPYEYEILTRWRTGNRGFAVTKRIAWARELSRTDPAQAAEILGNLEFESGNLVGATEHYSMACQKRKKDLTLQAKCRWLREKSAPAMNQPPAAATH